MDPQKRAKSAANGSWEDLKSVCSLIPNMAQDAVLFLPLLFVHLHPAGIPSPQELDAISGTVKSHPKLHRVLAATVALGAFSRLLEMHAVPVDSYLDLWPRIYPWILFVHTYWDAIPPQFVVLGSKQAYSVFSTIIIQINQHPDTSPLVRAAPGLHFITANWWATILRNDGVIVHEGDVTESDGWGELDKLLSFIGLDIEVARNFDEVVDGVGGIRHLASLLLKHIDMALASPPSNFRTGVIVVAFKAAYERIDGDGPFSTALLSRGGISTIIGALSALNTWNVRADSIKPWALMILRDSFQSLKSDRYITKALRAGLLPAIISVAIATQQTRLDGFNDCNALLVQLLEQILPASLVYYRVVRQIKFSLPTALVLASAPDFTLCAILPSWQRFEYLVTHRIAALDHFESPAWVCFKACENLRCMKIAKKSDLEKCSRCGVPYYCSQPCQKVDWKWSHRNVCRKPSQQNFSTREKSFIRSLMEYNFRFFPKLREDMLLRQLTFMYTHPGVAFVTVFDHAQMPLQGWIDVRSLEDTAVPDAPLRLSQLALKGERLQLYAAIGTGRGASWMIMFPAWSSSSRLHDGLAAIVKELPRGMDSHMDLVDFSEVHVGVKAKFCELVAQLDADNDFHRIS
ncbi:hypothetical protein DFH07DRAFT_990747 [Mycena maculata]|uniref:MYND-type domain-containing protein n=1 Tax=Mycena maculata TaxID=230809 RepID=A0AAD7I0S2_9AGAR|nr:hypothetical protein DFH07DRAFT_990747 [Mycena maculata]